jgi:superfamily II DNA or RNA helicase
MLRYIQQTQTKGLLVVPTTSLVEQMYTDFESYGYNSEEYCHRQYAGKDKVTDKFLTITTWQSIYKNPPEYFKQYDFVIGDEAHQFKAKSLATIMSSLTDTKYRIGCTGTLDGTQTHRLVLEGLFGPVYKATSTAELIDKGQLASFRIKCLILKYPDAVCKMAKEWDYNQEVEYIVMNTARNEFIKNLTLSLKGNTLILFQFVEKHGKDLHALIKQHTKNRQVFFVYGGTDVEVRESIRSITEKEKDAIIVASYGTFSTGVNIRNLHNIVFASPSKSKVRNLQSIGRGLRLGDDKEEAVLFDISDDFRIGKFTNYTLKHFIERVKMYDEEKFNYKFYNIELKNG